MVVLVQVEMIPGEHWVAHQVLGVQHLGEGEVDPVLPAQAPERVVRRGHHGSRHAADGRRSVAGLRQDQTAVTIAGTGWVGTLTELDCFACPLRMPCHSVTGPGVTPLRSCKR